MTKAQLCSMQTSQIRHGTQGQHFWRKEHAHFVVKCPLSWVKDIFLTGWGGVNALVNLFLCKGSLFSQKKELGTNLERKPGRWSCFHLFQEQQCDTQPRAWGILGCEQLWATRWDPIRSKSCPRELLNPLLLQGARKWELPAGVPFNYCVAILPVTYTGP